ncbi:hypothetical protein W97_06398 [Coniosporium apollinis CBS 100218]|uniref:Dihydrodipicolinate synthetase n=1 Tax=Coniosporium apollinis (strain CBS 100218) TaxID=1168221 RepID=R7YYY4_CONA1|nr:uncharacterized protein W97_06398 [Coniosporium apollinis CBS 100218]EON67145.1 hypothetical protein W97_06398 [Coniosporium apollinis CBS 100218]
MAPIPPKGIYVPVPTFFVSKSASNYDPVTPAVDISTQAKHALHLARSGIRGLVILGSTGEAVHLTSAERTQVLKGVREELEKAGFKGYPILAGTAAQSIVETVQHLEDAKDAGSQWGMCLAPGYFASAVSQQGIVDWFTAVADRSPIPILVYHYPGVSNNIVITPSTMEKLASHPNIVGCKLSHGDVADHGLIALSPNIDHSQFRTFTGLGQQLLPVLTLGGAGAIDGLAAIFPKTVVRLYNLFQEDQSFAQLEKMRELQYKISGGEKLVVKWGTIGVKEAVSRVLGFGDKDGGRLPLSGGLPGGETEWENWKHVMEALEAVEKTLPELESL